MQYQIPVPRQPIQGPTIQQTAPIPGVAGIEMSRYAALQSNRFLNSANVYIHQGPTIQATHPVPAVAKIEMSRYQALAWAPLAQPPEPPMLDGATVQATHPVPPVAKIEWSRYSALDSVRLIPGASVYLHQGATIQRTDPIAVFGQPNYALYPKPQYPTVAPLPTTIAVATQPTYIFPQPLPNLAAWPGRQYPDVPRQFTGATIQATNPIPGVPSIEWTRYRALDAVRAIPGAVAQIHQGATVQSTDPIPGVSKIEMSRWSALDAVRLIPGPPALPHQGATIQQTYIFPLPLAKPQYPVLQYPGPGPQLLQFRDTASYIFPMPQPNLVMWPGRQFPGAMSQLDQIFVPSAITGLTGTVRTLEHTYSVFSLSTNNTVKALP